MFAREKNDCYNCPMSKNNEKIITVLMAVFNQEKSYLKQSIDSILAQSLQDFEFIIVDDGSDEKKCLDLLDEYSKKDTRIRIIKNKKNLGLTKSLNKGLAEAAGKFIARIDSDDLADPKRLKKQREFMKKNQTCALCGSWSYIINEKSEIIGEKKFATGYREIKKKILFFNFFTHSSLFFRRDIILNSGGYNEKIKKAQDYDLILKISACHQVENIPEFLCFNRNQSKSISAQHKKAQEWYAILARWNAVWKYGYPKIYVLKIIPSLIYFIFMPHFIQKKIFNFVN